MRRARALFWMFQEFRARARKQPFHIFYSPFPFLISSSCNTTQGFMAHFFLCWRESPPIKPPLCRGEGGEGTRGRQGVLLTSCSFRTNRSCATEKCPAGSVFRTWLNELAEKASPSGFRLSQPPPLSHTLLRGLLGSGENRKLLPSRRFEMKFIKI